jgi:hypothetical protein
MFLCLLPKELCTLPRHDDSSDLKAVLQKVNALWKLSPHADPLTTVVAVLDLEDSAADTAIASIGLQSPKGCSAMHAIKKKYRGKTT